MKRDVIIACDFNSKEELVRFLERFGEERIFLKVGMELFYAEGPEIIREIKNRGHRIFLDLKLHDIPNTVKKAMRVLANLDVDMVNVHASGTVAMMEAALEGLTKEQLRLARNEIYARHGMIFGAQDLATYFATKTWYTPTVAYADFYDQVTISEIEAANVALIVDVEEEME